MTCSCLSSLAAAVAAALALLPAIASARVLWRGDFETGDTTQWSRSQIVSSDRMRVVASPVAQGGHAVRVLVKQGDDPINASGNRNELVYMSNETQGMERYYRWQTMFDPSYPSNRTWQVFTQFHHSGSSGSPPVEFDIYGEEIVLDVSGQAIWRAPLERGVWHDFVFHAKWSANASEGFVELYYDGRLVLPRRSAANMFSGQTNYLKQGLYRNDVITQDGIVFHDGFIIGETLEDVMPSGSPPAGQDAGAPAPGLDANHPMPADAAAPPDAAVEEPEPALPDMDASASVTPADAQAAVPGPSAKADAGVEGPTGPREPSLEPEPGLGCSSARGSTAVALGIGLLVLGLVLLRRRPE